MNIIITLRLQLVFQEYFNKYFSKELKSRFS